MSGGEDIYAADIQSSEISRKPLPENREPTQQPTEPPRAPPRAASPAKRSFTTMNQETDHGQNDAMELDDAANIVGVDSNVKKNSPVPMSPVGNVEDRHVRGRSVDMLSSVDAGEDTATSTATLSSHNQISTSATSVTESSPSDTAEGTAGLDEKDLPSYEEQVSEIIRLQNRESVPDQEGYVVSTNWLQRPWSRTPDNLKDSSIPKDAREGPVGPVDNTDIVQSGAEQDLLDEKGHPFVPLKPGLDISTHFEVVPMEAWQLIIKWYGVKKGSPSVRRYVHDTAPEGSARPNYQYELFPPIFDIRKLRHDSAEPTAISIVDRSPAPRVLASRSMPFQQFLAQAKTRVGIDLKTKVKVWRIIESIPTTEQQAQSGMLTPATSRSGSPNPAASIRRVIPEISIDLATFSEMEEGTRREMVDVKDETTNSKYNGSVKLDTVGLGMNHTLILEEQLGGPAGGEFVSDNIKPKTGLKGANKSLALPQTLSRASSPGVGHNLRSRIGRNGRPRGTVGLSNLGNTCYMNSALQCVRSCEELAIYFLEQKYKGEINVDNVLGHKGVLAKAYAAFIASIYDSSPTGSFAPRNLKNTVGRCEGGSVFSGYGQQDSQEFLSFLLDGLHEDLNRIIKKPSVQDPDSTDETWRDLNLIKELGDTFRRNHRSRNDSIVTDLFSGFYKNTMKCPVCDKVSIKFDPYSSLTLQLPLESTWNFILTFVPLGKSPIRVQVDMKKSSTFKDLKKFVADRFPGSDASRMVAAEIYTHKIYKMFEDTALPSESQIQKADDIVLYELSHAPTNYPPPKKKKKKQFTVYWDPKSSEEEVTDIDSHFADHLLVPVTHRLAGASAYSSAAPTLQPFFVVISKDEATDIDEIRRKILGHVANITTYNIFNETQPSAASSDLDGVVTTSDDASSETDGIVKAASLDSEASIVDVTMTGSGNKASGQTSDDTVPANESIPGPLRPGGFIPGELQRLFEMRVLKRGKDMLPNNWTEVGNREFQPLAARIPQIQESRRSSINSQTSRGSGSERSSAEETQATQDDMIHSFERNGDSESDSELPPMTAFHQKKSLNKYGKHGKRRGKGKLTTYGRKNQAARQTSTEPAFDDPSDVEESPRLIRLGEGLVLDWERESFDTLFGQTHEGDDMRGKSMWDDRPLHPDPELQARLKERGQRRKNGIELDACFEESARTEVLSEENAWYCNRCKEHRTASKTLEIWTAPDILVLHLKRFNSVRQIRDKLDLIVDFPIEGLDISKWVGLSEDKSLVYDLFAVDNHFGGLGGGHYTAYAQNFFDKKWYNYNDSDCSSVKPESLVSSSAYLLFYRRRSDTPLGPPQLQQLVADFWSPGTSDDQLPSAVDNDPSSGNGQRARDLYLSGDINGSSSALVGVGAGLASATLSNPRSTAAAEAEDVLATKQGSSSYANLHSGSGLVDYGDYEDPDNTLPAYPGGADEGIGLESLAGPVIGSSNYETQGWNWDSIPAGRANSENDFADDDSLRGVGGSEVGDGRLDDLDDFKATGTAGNVTPAESFNEEPTLDLAQIGDEVVDSMEYDRAGEEEVVEVRVGKGDTRVD